MAFIEIKTYIQFYHGAAWDTCDDVLQDPSPVWEYGLPGPGVMDLVAGTGTLTFTLDNSEANEAGLAGYYTIGHANAPAWFVDGMPIRVRVERQDDMTIATRFVGYLVSSRPSSGMYTGATTEIEARDWMDYAASQKLGLQAIQTGAGLGVDNVLTSALLSFPLQPTATDFDVGRESFPAIFNTDDSLKMTMMSLFQKYARNECVGYIFLEGDGTLRFDNRHVRPLATTDSFTLDASASTPMTDLDVAWDRDQISNKVEVKVLPAETDAGADTILWQLRDTFALGAGKTVTLTCPFSDPDTGVRISGSSVVTPLVSGTHIKFGSIDDGATNDLIASLTFPMTVGGNSAEIVLTNTGIVNGYINLLKILGDGIYVYEPIVVTVEDAASIALRGEKFLSANLEQVTSPVTAKLMADFLLGQLSEPAHKVERVRFLANSSDAFATAALTVEPNTRFKLVETQTAVNHSYFACRLRFEQIGPLLWVEIVPSAPAAANLNYFIWNLADHGWNEGVWIF